MTTTATTTCPPVETLRRYCLGEYSDADGDRIEKHLSECAACEAALSELDETNDSLVRHLPLTGHSDQQGESGWLQRLMAFPPDDSAPTTTNDDIVDECQNENSFDAYELSGILGQGGMGVVYAARHRQLGRPVAIKVVNPRLVAAKEAQRRFDREIQVLGTLNHPGIVSATDAGRIAGAAYLVMERIEGADLASIVRKQGPLSISEACEIARQIALALASAHDAGAVHRDVKPSNVMLDQSGRVKLLDFGLAHLAESAGSHEETSLGRLLGTLDYMSPEQAGGEQVGRAADLYGLGATLFFLLSGRPPKVADRSQTLLRQLKALTEDAAPRLNDVRGDIPAELNDLVAALLDRDPGKRPASAAQVATELKTWAESASESLSQLASSVESQKPLMTDGAEVARSLSSLLGRDASQRTLAVASDSGGHHRVGWLIATMLIAFAVLIYFGIIVLIRTDQGTIRIESEVAGVTVELLDEDAQVERPRIERQAGQTKVEAGKYHPDSLLAILQRYNDETRQERQEKFTPPIDDLSLEELMAAFKSAARMHRNNGEHAIADALEDTVTSKRLADSLEFGGVMGASQRSQSDGEVVFRQILPGLNIETGPNSAKLVVLSQAELRWSRDGWSSPDWGEIHPPIDGTWKLHSVKADGADLDDAAFERFCEQHPAWMTIRISNEDELTLDAESSPQPFKLRLSYQDLSRFQMVRDGKSAYQGLFMGNGFIDDTELRLTLDLSGGPPPQNYRTEGTDAITLDYRRAKESIDSKASNHPQYPPSPEFPPVKISIFDEDGVPAAGAKVAMRFRNPANGAAEIDAEHVTGADGVAVDRILPYGKYYAIVKTSDGWYMSIRELPVEFGKGIRLKVIVPSPQHRATLKLAAATGLHQIEGLKKLPMGDLRDYFTKRNSSFSPITTPEPSDDLGRFSTFPTLGNGVDQLAVAIRFDVHRIVPQPADSPPEVDGEWIWLPDHLPKFRSYFLIDGKASPKLSVNVFHRRPAKDGKFFRDLGSSMQIGYIQYEFADPIPLPTTIDIPAGLVTVHLTGIYGRATAEVARSLGIQPPSDDQPRIWLSENVKADSEWVQMIPGTKDWFYRKPERTHHHHLLRVENALTADETMVVALHPATD
ncbi:serine/threonine-protein kinase [Stieleria maiorica]|nr:serine/threonine-protein kinase [Stieleria maiorica]